MVNFLLLFCCKVIFLLSFWSHCKENIHVKQTMCTVANVNVPRTPMSQLVSLMKISPPQEVVRMFTDMSSQEKVLFLNTMNIKQYATFLKAFSEKDWSDMWLQLPVNEQNSIPCSYGEQNEMLEDAWRAFAEKCRCSRVSRDESVRHDGSARLKACVGALVNNYRPSKNLSSREKRQLAKKAKEILKCHFEANRVILFDTIADKRTKR